MHQEGTSSSGLNSSRTGTMPKTISFDKTAERGDRENWDDESGRTRRFFRNFRLPFRGRSRKPVGTGRHDGYDAFDRQAAGDSASSLLVPKLRKSLSEDVSSPLQGSNESSDDILAKYRRKPSLTDSNDGSNSTSGNANSSPKLISFGGASGSMNNSPASPAVPVSRKESLKISRAEICNDARKKLRNVICNCDLQTIQAIDGIPVDVALINILRMEIASAISRADQVGAPQLQESIRTRTIKQLRIDG